MAKLGKAATKRRGRAPKVEAVSELEKLLQTGDGIVLMNNNGLTLGQMTALRKRLRSKGVAVKVAKNTLLKRALATTGYDTDGLADRDKRSLDKALSGPTIIAIGLEDPVTPAKEVQGFIKENEEARLEIKGGLLEKKLLTASQVDELAKLPGREELISRLLGSMNAPAQNLAGVLYACVAQFGYALAAHQRKLEEGGEEAA
jgi:large subunit ribosomal protein L10